MLNFWKKEKIEKNISSDDVKGKNMAVIPADLSGFRNIHLGERCFIIGNGPSLKAEDLDHLKNEFTFGVNRIYLIFDQTNWRPTYYAIQDQKLMERYGDDVAQLDLPVKFVSNKAKDIIKGGKGHYYYYNYVRRLYDGSEPEFSDDISKQTYEGGTVTYLCMQIAAYMGFKEIYLIGNDFNYSVSKTENNIVVNNVKDYFTDKYISSDENRFFPRLDLCEVGFKYAKKVLSAKNIEVFNATRGGKLEVFPRIKFDDIKFK